jgi:glycosyltransferase involved in cell wall biosynthesis
MAGPHVLQGKLKVPPLVTVAMSVHNGATTLIPALQSLLWQTFSDWELIIVNDASTDSTGEVLRRFRDSRMEVIVEKEQKGLAAGLNQCIARARGQYIARMDADDIAYPERFERQVRYLRSHPDIDLLGHGAVLFKGRGELIGQYPRAESHESICRRPWWGFPLAHPTWMGKRDWFLGHPYNRNLTKGQDQDLLLRSYRSSHFAALPDILLGYRMDAISFLKSARGRLNYCRQLVAQTCDFPSASLAARGVLIHSLALARDLILDLAGTTSRRSRQSFTVADQSIKENWQMIWERLCEEDVPLVRS